jgi:hypothetical protein
MHERNVIRLFVPNATDPCSVCSRERIVELNHGYCVETRGELEIWPDPVLLRIREYK